MPRPDQIYRQLRHQQSHDGIDTELLQDIVGHYNLNLQGETSAPAVSGRGDSLIFDTLQGKKVLKRYKHTVAPQTIIHEHSILKYLASMDFPAPRLTVTVDGQTLQEIDGACYTLFDYIEGYFHYHQYFFTPQQTRRLITVSAKALASLHYTLKDFVPEGAHPNGFKSRTEARWRDLAWYIDQLNGCRQYRQRPSKNISASMIQMFKQYADWVEERLTAEHNKLESASPLRLIIHGDYGPYNLFFRTGSSIIVLDFELARLDWRITDLSKSFVQFAQTRFGFSIKKMKYFLEAYHTSFPLGSSEISLIPTVWQFLTLRRVIVCWQRYFQTYSENWVKEAERKLNLARWIDDNYDTLSCLIK